MLGVINSGLDDTFSLKIGVTFKTGNCTVEFFKKALRKKDLGISYEKSKACLSSIFVSSTCNQSPWAAKGRSGETSVPATFVIHIKIYILIGWHNLKLHRIGFDVDFLPYIWMNSTFSVTKVTAVSLTIDLRVKWKPCRRRPWNIFCLITKGSPAMHRSIWMKPAWIQTRIQNNQAGTWIQRGRTVAVCRLHARATDLG